MPAATGCTGNAALQLSGTSAVPAGVVGTGTLPNSFVNEVKTRVFYYYNYKRLSRQRSGYLLIMDGSGSEYAFQKVLGRHPISGIRYTDLASGAQNDEFLKVIFFIFFILRC